MKESTSELNATVVVVLAIAVLIAFFYYTIWPLLKHNFERNSQCSKAICETTPNTDGMVKCHAKNDNQEFFCVYKG